MHVHFLDPYQPGSSALHRLDARLKLTLTLAFILTAALTPSGAFPVYLLLFAIILSAGLLSDLGVMYIQKRAALALPFVLAALPLLFTIPGQPLFGVSLGSLTLTATHEGLLRFLSIALKSWISVQAAVLLAGVTPFPALLAALRALRVPPLLVAIFSLMWRYLFVLVDEALRLLRARQARSGHSDLPGLKPGGSLPWRAAVAGGMAGSLFLRAFERSDRIYMAMLARGYDGEVRTEPLARFSAANWLILAGSLLLLGLLLALSLLLWG